MSEETEKHGRDKNTCSSAGERPAGVTSEGEDLQILQQETQMTGISGRRRDGFFMSGRGLGWMDSGIIGGDVGAGKVVG